MVQYASTRTIAMLTFTDSTATSAIDGNNSSFNRSTASSTAPNCQPNYLDHSSFSGDFKSRYERLDYHSE
ncbi:hypothetical protein GCM10018779_33500 [Streptomyces griseocarneus]|nr:hypothetical protein GCM10018779_33500 [Streptomyces griseocarneus]